MKKFSIFILSNLLLLLVLVLIFSLNIGKVVNKNIINNLIKNTVITESTKVLVEDEVPEEKIDVIKSKIQSNKSIDEMVSKYADITMDSLSGKNIDDIDLSSDMKTIIIENKSIIEDELNVKVSDSDLEKAIDEANQSGELTKVYKETIENTKSNLSEEAVSALKIYNMIIKIDFQLFVLVGIIIVCGLIGIIKKSLYKWLFNLGMSSLISSIINTMLFTLFTLFINLSLDNIGNSFTVNVLDSVILPIIVFVISIVLLIIYKILKSKFKEEEVI